ncbi:MAG TPA: T9SS type A sorting domain-containing protein [Bacteroidales bacterium]|nr:T9SS type A sorting domain-containing protein [Bacteroidales bacterium]
MKKVIFSLIGIIPLLLGGRIDAQQISVYFDSTYQIIRGFGGIHITSWTGRELTPDMMEKAFDNDPGEMGLSIFRMQISEDTMAWKNELSIARYARSKGAIVFASPWNPPSYMRKVKGTYNNETDYELLEEYYDDYAQHLNKFISFMADSGVPLYAISIQNEPDWHGWTTWTSQAMIKFLKEQGHLIQAPIIAPESYGFSRSFIDPLLNDSLANARIAILGTHIYGTPISNYSYPLAVQKGKEIWMTEHLLGSDKPESNTWALAMVFANEVNACMQANMSAYVYWYIRRFYGLIDDAGNITDKGYVLSHFSKFIRPGFRRILSKSNNLNKVSTTAFRTDSSLVIVVVNTNTNAVAINFNIAGLPSSFDSLVQFTSSATKKMQNDGIIQIHQGQFTATVDAMSITTFTTHSGKGGRYGNLPPIAIAGNDTTILDTVGSGVFVNISALKSYDIDGVISKFNWARNGYQISNEAELTLKLNIGTHTFLLSITDNDGSTSFDTLVVTIKSNKTTQLWLEAECTALGDQWDLISDDLASNGYYLMVNPAYESTDSSATDMSQLLQYKFNITEKGKYKIWGRVLAPTPNDDSFWVRVDDGDWMVWDNIPNSSSWAWDDVHHQSNANDTLFFFDVGEHTLTVSYRENGVAIDKWYITNTGKKPSGKGGVAEGCYNGNNIATLNEGRYAIFPNPARNEIWIQGNDPIEKICIYNSSGALVYRGISVGQMNEHLQISLPNGLYMVQVISVGGKSYFEKLIIRR